MVSLSEFYVDKTILISGATGYIGWNLSKALSKFDCTIRRLTQNKAHLDSIENKAKFEDFEVDYGSKTDWSNCVATADIIFHLAAQTSVYKAEHNPDADYACNVVPMKLLMEACRKKSKKPTVIFAGTSTQCGLPSQIPVDESIADCPISIYDFHKNLAEQYLMYYSRKECIKGISLRLTNVYGPGPKSSNVDRGILNMMIRKALKGDVLTIYGSGACIRDYIYIDDVIAAFLIAPREIDTMAGNHFVLGSGQGATISDAINLVANMVATQTGEKARVEYVDPPTELHPIEHRNFIADTKALNENGIEPISSLSQGIKETIKFFQEIK